MSRTTMESVVDMLSYRSLLRYAKSLSLPGNLKKCEYIEVLKLHRMGLDAECKALAYTMKTKKRETVIKSPAKNIVQKKSSAGRPRKLMAKIQPLSNTPSKLKTKYTRMPGATVENFQINQSVMSNSTIPEMYPSSSLQNIVCDPPISKSTSERLRSVLLSTDRSKFNQAAANNNNFFNFRLKTWTDIVTENSNSFVNDTTKLAASGNSYLLDLQSFPDIPLLADAVDINASFDLDNSKNMNDPNNRSSGLFDDSDTLSSQSAADSTEREQRDIDRRLVMSIRTENTSSEFMKCDALNPLDDSSLLGPQDTALVQNDVIQNYIDKNNVQFMQLPDSSCEVIQTLEFYESNNVNESMPNDHAIQDEQFNVAETNNTLAEFANMLPCPIAGCNWHSHSATLYVHLSTCHQQMIFYGNSITHVFRCQDIRNFCYFTHLQFVQNTMYIITVALCSYSNTVVATIQHVSSSGDNTSVSPTTAVLTSGFLRNKNDKQHSWTGQVQPYSVPLDLLHADGKCLFIDPSDVEQRVVVHVNLTGPFLFPGNPLLTCL